MGNGNYQSFIGKKPIRSTETSGKASDTYSKEVFYPDGASYSIYLNGLNYSKDHPGNTIFSAKLTVKIDRRNTEEVKARIAGGNITLKKGDFWKLPIGIRAKFFESILMMYSRSGHDNSSDFQTASIQVYPNEGEKAISISSNMSHLDDFERFCAERLTFGIAKAFNKNYETFDELHVYSSSPDPNSPSISFPCGHCLEASKKYFHQDTLYIIHPDGYKKAGETDILYWGEEDKLELNKIPLNTIVICKGKTLIPHTKIILTEDAQKAVRNAVEELEKPDHNKTKIKELKIHDERKIKPLPDNPQLHEVNTHHRQIITVGHNNRRKKYENISNERILDSASVTTMVTIDGRPYTGWRFTGATDKAVSRSGEHSINELELMHRPVVRVITTGFSKEADFKTMELSLKDAGRAIKRDFPGAEIEFTYIPFNLIGIGDKLKKGETPQERDTRLNKEVEAISQTFRESEIIPSAFRGVPETRSKG